MGHVLRRSTPSPHPHPHCGPCAARRPGDVLGSARVMRKRLLESGSFPDIEGALTAALAEP
ncbi:hypothetical protein GCM10010276_82720 [Streptomyces longisporus]|uniref:Uncharacterized protein n=1 Tax=Streptomyces longisporus TaxID=1948 RepID=A0ABP6APM3_STRLO